MTRCDSVEILGDVASADGLEALDEEGDNGNHARSTGTLVTALKEAVLREDWGEVERLARDLKQRAANSCSSDRASIENQARGEE